MKINALFVFCIGLVLFGLTVSAHGEERTVSAMAPWEGDGKIFKVEPEKLLFVGSFTGVMYLSDGKGSLDAAIMVCPATQEINLKDETTSGQGRCILTSLEGDKVYAQWSCSGKPGICMGDFKLNGGTGRFTGITGSGPLHIRTILMGIAVNIKDGGTVEDAHGLAIWPELKFKIPPR